LVLLIFALAGCTGNPTPQVISFVPSLTPGAKVPTRMPTSTLDKTATPTPSETSTATESPTPATPVAEAVREIPVRFGPNSSYPVATSIPTGNQLPITGISEDGNWYQVMLPDGSKGWVTAASALVTTYGNVGGVPVALAPTNTPTDTVTPTETATHTPTPTPTDTPEPTDTPTRTPQPSPTSTPQKGLPDSIDTGDFQSALRQLGVTPESGALSATIDKDVVDLTGEDNLIQW
jgi:uncharacterized protein YraI